MSDENNVIDMVEAAQKKGKFSLVDAIKGRAFPEKAVDVYIDAASAYEFAELEALAKTLDPETPEYATAVDKMDELAKAIKDSKLTFHMKGVGQGLVEKVTEEANKLYPDAQETNDPGWVKHYLCALIAGNIVKVTDLDGNEDSSEFTVEDVMQLRDIMPIDSWEILIDTMQKLTLATSYFEAVTDAGFLPKS
jgi:hypothetical protein